MSIRIEVDQTRTVEAAEVYRVVNTVTYVEGIDANIFIYVTETGIFSHVAYPYDMRTFPKTQQEASNDGLGYYRQVSATVDYDNVALADAAASYTLSRVDTLARTMNAVDTEFVGETEHVAIGG